MILASDGPRRHVRGTARRRRRPARLTWTYADDRANDAQPRDPEVDRVVARVFAARARQEAVALNRDGDYERARPGSWPSTGAADPRLRRASDAELREIADALLEAEQVLYAAPMAESERKQTHFASANVARSRDAHGALRAGRSLIRARKRACDADPARIVRRVRRPDRIRTCPAADARKLEGSDVHRRHRRRAPGPRRRSAWAFYGLKVFTILLPIWAFFFGLTSGRAVEPGHLRPGLLRDGPVVGHRPRVRGLFLAVISFFWYYAAVTIAGGALGYMLGVGLMDWLGIDAASSGSSSA